MNYSEVVDANLLIAVAGKQIAEAMRDSSVNGQQLVYSQLAAWGEQGNDTVYEALTTAVAANWAAIQRGG